jgi:hypothetical protein
MPAVEVLFDVASQLRRAGMTGVVTGFDYAAVHAALAMRGVPRKHWSQLFDDIRVMEDAAIDFLNKQK